MTAQAPDDSGESDFKVSFPEANIEAVRGMAKTLATTLGPTPRDKLVVNTLATREDTGHPAVPAIDDYVATSDGTTILTKIPLRHPIAPIVRDVTGPDRPGETDVEGKDIPDGVTTTLVLAGALLNEAATLLERGVHPRDVTRGFHVGADVAKETLDELARPPEEFPNGNGLHAAARTAMTGNDVGGHADRWAQFAADAVKTVGRPTERSFAVRQTSDGSVDDSRLVRGAVLDANCIVHDRMARAVSDADVLVIGGHDRGGLQDPEVNERYVATPESPEQVEGFRNLFADNRHAVVERIGDVGADVVVTQLGITQEYQSLLADLGVVGIRNVTSLDLLQVASATGAAVVKNPEDVHADHLGHAGRVRELTVGSRRDETGASQMVVFEDCSDPDAVTVLLHGVTERLGEQATTQVRKAANAAAVAAGKTALRGGIVPGGGATDIAIANRVRDLATADATRVQLATNAFADAVTQVVATLASNGGMDPIDTVASLRRDHANGEPSTGLVFPSRTTGDTWSAGIVDPAGIRREQYTKAVQVANVVLSIDDAVDATFSEDLSGTEDAIFEKPAERHEEHVAENETRWG